MISSIKLINRVRKYRVLIILIQIYLNPSNEYIYILRINNSLRKFKQLQLITIKLI